MALGAYARFLDSALAKEASEPGRDSASEHGEVPLAQHPAASVERPAAPGSARRSGRSGKRAGRRGSSEDDLPLRLNHAQDRGVGRGLNPAPDERRPAVFEYDERFRE